MRTSPCTPAPAGAGAGAVGGEPKLAAVVLHLRVAVTINSTGRGGWYKIKTTTPSKVTASQLMAMFNARHGFPVPPPTESWVAINVPILGGWHFGHRPPASFGLKTNSWLHTSQCMNWEAVRRFRFGSEDSDGPKHDHDADDERERDSD